MIKNLSAFFLLISIILLTASRCICFQEEEIPEEISVVTWNVCNLFDSSDDGTEYAEYDPSGGTWNRDLYLTRLNNTAAVISSIQKRDIILLQEIENRKILEDLAEIMKKDNYRYIAAAEKGEAAVTTGLLSSFPLEEVRNHAIASTDSSFLRPVFEVKISIGDNMLHIFNNHWKSKLGGAENTENERRLAASVITRRISEILENDPGAEIIIAGDLNENIDEYERTGKQYYTAIFPESSHDESSPDNLVFYTYNIDETGLSGKRNIFFSVWGSLNNGSYYYRNCWETIDHFFINRNLLDNEKFRYTSCTVHSKPFFTDKNNIPVRWENFRGSGYSDHLPLVLNLRLSE